MNGTMRRAPAAAIAMVLALAMPLPALAADDAAITSTLTALKGKRATLKLDSGQELTGVVSSVTDDTVTLTELTGMEFFDAVVRMDRVEAVVMRRVSQ